MKILHTVQKFSKYFPYFNYYTKCYIKNEIAAILKNKNDQKSFFFFFFFLSKICKNMFSKLEKLFSNGP